MDVPPAGLAHPKNAPAVAPRPLETLVPSPRRLVGNASTAAPAPCALSYLPMKRVPAGVWAAPGKAGGEPGGSGPTAHKRRAFDLDLEGESQHAETAVPRALLLSTRASSPVLRWLLGFSRTTRCRWVLRLLLLRPSAVLLCLSSLRLSLPVWLLRLRVGFLPPWFLPSLRLRLPSVLHRLRARSPSVLSRLLSPVLLQWLRPLRLPAPCLLRLAFLRPVGCLLGLRTPLSPPSTATRPTSTPATRSSALRRRRLWPLWCLRPLALPW